MKEKANKLPVNKRNEEIRASYKQLKEDGKKQFEIMNQLADKYSLSLYTILYIVYHRDKK